MRKILRQNQQKRYKLRIYINVNIIILLFKEQLEGQRVNFFISF